MDLQFVILFFATAIIEKGLANECGTTTSQQDGNTATITFTPDTRFAEYSRTWVHRFKNNDNPKDVLNSSVSVSPPTKYMEENSDGRFILKIHNVTISDSGLYNVRCYYQGANTIYSETTTLNITRVPSTKTSSLKPSTKQVPKQTTSVGQTTSQQTVTTPLIPTQPTSQNKETEETSQQKKTEDGVLLAPVIGGVAGTVVVVVACAVLLTVYQKRCKKQESKPPAQSKAKGSKTGTEKTLSTEEIPEYASVKPKDKRKCAEKTVDGADECPEYSKVVPKSERTSDAKNDVQTKSICETTEAANKQLVYAELDLEHPKANTKDTERHQETDHVEIGLSKTISSHDSKRVTEQLEQTEYVTIDFSKTDQVN